jgi:hypothetical protein
LSGLLKTGLVTILTVSLLVAGCARNQSSNNSTPKEPDSKSKELQTRIEERAVIKYRPSLEAKDVLNKTDKEMAEILFRKYLEYFKSEEIPPWNRIVDYRVTEFQVVKTGQSGFMNNVDYDVKPFIKDSAWVAGTGTDGPDGWLIRKAVMFFVQKGNSSYQITEMGTGLAWKE